MSLLMFRRGAHPRLRRKESILMKRCMVLGVMMCVVGLTGCVGSGEVMKIRLNDMMQSTMGKAGENLMVSVSGFEDQRPPSNHLGTHVGFFGGVAYFDLLDGNLDKGISEAFVNFLQQSGFHASNGSRAPGDVRIAGKVTKFSANATGQFLSTNIKVDAIMEFTIENGADGSTVRMTIGAGGTDDVVFFEAADLESLVNEVLQEGFEELIEKTIVEGKTLRRKV